MEVSTVFFYGTRFLTQTIHVYTTAVGCTMVGKHPKSIVDILLLNVVFATKSRRIPRFTILCLYVKET